MTSTDSVLAGALQARAETIRAAREALLISQDQLAQAAGVSVSTIARLERGRQVSAESLKAVCAVLQFNAGDLRAAAMAPPPEPTAPPEPAAVSRDPDDAMTPAPPGGLARRIAVRMASVLGLGAASYLLSLAAMDVAAQTSRLELAPYRATYQDYLRGMTTLLTTREVNMASKRYSSAVPKTDREGEWEPWRTIKPVTWFTCGATSMLGASIVRIVGLTPDVGDSCQEHGIPMRMTRRDGERTDFLVGPLPRRDLDLFLVYLTGDPSVRIRAAITPIGDVPSEGKTWFDPRSQAGFPAGADGAKEFLHLRLSSES